jgi:hypothetical protein
MIFSSSIAGDIMRQKAVPAATLIIAASLIGITQARLPRPVRDYRDRVNVEMPAVGHHEATATRLGSRIGGPVDLM